MKPFQFALFAIALQQVTAIGFTTYAQILEDTDNSGTIAYSALDRSNTLFLYIQIIAGSDHSQIIQDFQALSQNYGSQGVSVIPRVRYGNSDGSIATEPDESILMSDVSTWASVFSGVSNTINIPVIQAGFLGQWGEWHVSTILPQLITYRRARMDNTVKPKARLIVSQTNKSKRRSSTPFLAAATRLLFDILRTTARCSMEIAQLLSMMTVYSREGQIV